MNGHDADIAFMHQALRLADRGLGRVSPRPMVGAVIVDPSGAIVGEGWFEGPAGSPHAEVRALAQAGSRALGATLYCTLEPCSHHGATPPCTDAIVTAGVARVVVACVDPNPLVHGSGTVRLRDAGVDVSTGVLETEARRSNAAFERHVTTGLPFVIWKVAASLDGKTAAIDGSSRWISSPEARKDAHRLRAWADAVIVGSRTVLGDDPRLTARGPSTEGVRQPTRVVVDTAGRVPPTARVFDGSAPTLVATSEHAPEGRIDAWLEAGADVILVEADRAGGVSPTALLRDLGKRDIQGALLEGGATLAWSFLREGAVDRIVQYVAPKIIGGAGAPGVVAGGGFAPIDAALQVSFERVDRIGPDLRIEADVHRDR